MKRSRTHDAGEEQKEHRGDGEMNIAIPSDLSVFAFSHDSIFTHEFTPSLSGVRLNGEILGSAAAKLLIDQLKQGKQIATRIFIPTELVIRDSCGPMKTDFRRP